MTVAELIEHLQTYDSTQEIAYSLWFIEDIRQQAQDEGIEITDVQCVEILDRINRWHDATIGINWEVISCHIDSVINP